MKRFFLFGIIGAIVIIFVFLAVSRTSSKDTLLGETVLFGDVSLNLEYATTTLERERGLGGRTSLPEDSAMLFVFAKDDQYGFWMKDTLIPLDIFWLNAQGHVVYIAANVATSSYPNVFYPSVPARYVLETNAGFAKAHTIDLGTILKLKNLLIVSE